MPIERGRPRPTPPGLDQRDERRLRPRCRLAVGARAPGPAHEGISRYVLDDLVGTVATVALGIPYLRADLRERALLPPHRSGREMPPRNAGHAAGIKVRLPVTCRAPHGRDTEAV